MGYFVIVMTLNKSITFEPFSHVLSLATTNLFGEDLWRVDDAVEVALQ